ncbi:MAG: ATP-binding protein [Prevotella sp.]
MFTHIYNKVKVWVKGISPLYLFTFLLFYLFTFLPLASLAQGVPYLRNFPATEYKAHNQNNDVIAANDGSVFVANFEGLLYYDNADWRIIHTPGITRITAVFQDAKGRLWTGGYNYFGYLKTDANGNLCMQPCQSKQPFQGEVQWIWEKDGNVYFLVSDRKIYGIQQDESYSWAPGKTIPTSNRKDYQVEADITQVEDLEDGLQALSTNGSGVIFVDSTGREMFRVTEYNGLCSNNVNHIDYNRHGLLWGATDNGVFCIAFPSVYRHFTDHEGLRGEVLAIEQFGGSVYAGTLSGLFLLHGRRFHSVTAIKHACWQLVRQGGSLLAATSGGVYRIDANHGVTQLTTGHTLSVLPDDNDAFYCGEVDGVYYHSGKVHRRVNDIEKVTKIVRDKGGTIWLQNIYGRLWKSEGNNDFKPFGKGEQDEVSTLVDFGNILMPIGANTTRPVSYPLFSYLDQQGFVWLTDNKGKHLYAFHNGAKDSELSAAVYPLMDYSVRAMMRDEKMLWMGGDKGINIVDCGHRENYRVEKPRLLLRSVLLRGDSVLWGGYGPQPQSLPQLPSNERHIVFNYSIDYPSLLLKTQYRTRMNGGQWSVWEPATKEEYSNLPYGDFLFEVQASDAFGHYSDIVGISFSIDYPYYMRWYMIVLYLLLAAIVVYLLLQLRLRKLERDKNRLERIVSERTTEVVRLEKMATVGKLTQGLIDRILNPLNYINNFAKLSEGLVGDVRANIEDEKEHIDADNYDDTMDVLDMLKGNLQKVGEHGASTTRTLKAMEEMLKDRSGGIVAMNLTPLLHQNAEMVRNYFNTEIAQYGIHTSFDIPSQAININGNAEQLSKTFMNMLSNAVYAVAKKSQRTPQGTHYQPEISLRTSLDGSHVTLTFRDNGIGIEQGIIHKIFDPFFTTKTTAEASGIGLYLSHEIIQNHGGTLTVESEKNEYTEFIITLPYHGTER